MCTKDIHYVLCWILDHLSHLQGGGAGGWVDTSARKRFLYVTKLVKDYTVSQAMVLWS